MRILVDALPVANASGTGYYAQKLLEALARLETPHEIVAVTPPLDRAALDRVDWPGGSRVRVVEAAPARPAFQALWRQWRVGALARRERVDLVHYPAFIASLLCDTPAVVTIPDLVWCEWGRTVPRRKRRYYDRMIPRSMRRARRIIAISEATAAGIARHFPEVVGKVRTVPLGVDLGVFHPVRDPARMDAVRRTYRLPERYILALGTLEPRKNLSRLIQAFVRVASDASGVHLVLAGKAGFQADALREQARNSGVAGRIVFSGHIAAAALPTVYSLADAFAFPSLDEGFGLPILEAMACGVPVLTGNRSAMREVAGDAAELVAPDDTKAIECGLRRVLTDADYRTTLRERGCARVREFTWERTARETVAVYEEALA